MTAPEKLLINPDLKRNNFDLMRLALAILVLYSHSFIIYFGNMDSEPGKRFTQGQTELGTMAVYCFFIISGFLILRSFDNSTDTRSYLKKRILRICPGFFVAFLFSLLVAGPLGTFDAEILAGNWMGYFSSLSIKRFLLDFFTLQSPHAPACFETLPLPREVNGSMWTIQHEALCYLLVPLLVAGGLFRKKWVLPGLFGLALGTMLLLDLPQLSSWQGASTKLFNYPAYLPRFVVYFLAGCFYYVYRHQDVRSRWLALGCTVALLFAARFGGFGLLFPFAGTYLLFYIAYHPRFSFVKFASRGDLSYGTYLYAWPVQQLTLFSFKDVIGINLFFLLSLFATLAFAFASWHLVEHPFLQLKKKEKSKEKNAPFSKGNRMALATLKHLFYQTFPSSK